MSHCGDQIGWDRVAALIEECRAEREACETIREQLGQGDARMRSIYAAVTERLLSGAVEVHAVALKDDATADLRSPGGPSRTEVV